MDVGRMYITLHTIAGAKMLQFNVIFNPGNFNFEYFRNQDIRFCMNSFKSPFILSFFTFSKSSFPLFVVE